MRQCKFDGIDDVKPRILSKFIEFLRYFGRWNVSFEIKFHFTIDNHCISNLIFQRRISINNSKQQTGKQIRTVVIITLVFDINMQGLLLSRWLDAQKSFRFPWCFSNTLYLDAIINRSFNLELTSYCPNMIITILLLNIHFAFSINIHLFRYEALKRKALRKWENRIMMDRKSSTTKQKHNTELRR